MSMTRRRFVSATACAAALALTGCGSGGLTSGGSPDWSATRDDTLPALGADGDGAAAIPARAWAAREGYIQLQLVGASLPEPSVKRIYEDDAGALAIELERSDGPQTMDLAMSEWRLEVHEGSVEAIERVVVDGEEVARAE